jgi:hypothetical protein
MKSAKLPGAETASAHPRIYTNPSGCLHRKFAFLSKLYPMSSYLTLTVVALTTETPDTVTIHLERPDRQSVASKPGQFLTLLVP